MTNRSSTPLSDDDLEGASKRPLFRRFPELMQVLPIVAYADLPTPIEPIPRLGLSSDGQARAWIKRDDLSHPQYGGNKLRKLEFIRGEIRQKGVSHVYTFGATGTNAGLATAKMCADEGVPCTVFLFDQPPSPTVEKHYQALQSSGARLVHCGSLLMAALAFYLHPARLKADHYFLYAGCSNPSATFGFVNAAFELADQIQQGEAPEPAALFVATSSGSTLAGLSLGCSLAGLRTRVIGIRVAPEKLGIFDACNTRVVEKQQLAAMRFLQRYVPQLREQQLPAIELSDAWYGEGYGVPTKEGEAALRRFADFGYVLESTYTAKAAAAFLDTVETGSADHSVLFWNSYNSRPLS